MDLGLNDRVAIVTGSSKGLGFFSAQALISEGCRVVICARTPDLLQEARRRLAEIGGDDRVLAVVADVSRESGIHDVINGAVTTFGGIDVLVNNVGLAKGSYAVSTAQVTIRPRRNRNRRQGDQDERARLILQSLKAYLMAKEFNPQGDEAEVGAAH